MKDRDNILVFYETHPKNAVILRRRSRSRCYQQIVFLLFAPNYFFQLIEISDNVFQEIILGSILWKIFFADVSDAATLKNGQEISQTEVIHTQTSSHKHRTRKPTAKTSKSAA